MTNLENENKSINNLSKDAVDGADLKGGGTPGWIDPMETGDAGWLNPNDPMSGIHHANQSQNPGGLLEASDSNDPATSAILDPLLSPMPTNNPSI